MKLKKKTLKTNHTICAVTWSALIILSLSLFACTEPAPTNTHQISDQKTANSHTETAHEEIAVRTVGLLDTDGSVLYSVILVSGPEHSIGDLTVTCTVPEDAAFIEDVAAPPGATFALQTESNNAAVWYIDQLDADTIMGPFTYRVKLADQTDSIPTSPDALVSWTEPSEGSVEAVGNKSPIQPLVESGSLIIDENGTLGYVTVGDTGILIEVPAGAVTEPVTLTLTRTLIDANEDFLKSIPESEHISWCAAVRMSSEQAIKFAQPIGLRVPTNQTLTPGLLAHHFTRLADSTVPLLSGGSHDYILSDGNSVIVSDILLEEFQDMTLNVGINTYDKTRATVNRSQLEVIGFYGPAIDWFQGKVMEGSDDM